MSDTAWQPHPMLPKSTAWVFPVIRFCSPTYEPYLRLSALFALEVAFDNIDLFLGREFREPVWGSSLLKHLGFFFLDLAIATRTIDFLDCARKHDLSWNEKKKDVMR